MLGTPGLVKIAISSLNEKKSNLHENRKLRDVDAYKTVFIRSSKLFITKKKHLLTIIHLLSANSIKFQLKELYDMR